MLRRYARDQQVRVALSLSGVDGVQAFQPVIAEPRGWRVAPRCLGGAHLPAPSAPSSFRWARVNAAVGMPKVWATSSLRGRSGRCRVTM